MKDNKISRNEFLTNRDETGNMVYVMPDGHQYFIEVINNNNKRVKWGDVDTATDKIQGSYGDKYEGSIKPEQSIITEENGFKNITWGEGSIESTIEKMEKVRLAKG